ncbi:MAG: VOC family protein [Lachnospiraceae bacterium]
MFTADHYAISVEDVEKCIVFYEKLGFSVIKDYKAEDGSVRIVQMKNNGFILEMFAYPDSEELPAFVNTLGEDLKVKGSKHLGLQVQNPEKAAKYLLETGLLEKMPEICKGRLGRSYFFIKDPNGIFVEIISSEENFCKNL